MKYFKCASNSQRARKECRGNSFFKSHINPLNKDEVEAVSMQDRLRQSMELGIDSGARVNPAYDEVDSESIDVTSDFRQDPFSIAESFGKMPDSGDATPPPSDEPGETE